MRINQETRVCPRCGGMAIWKYNDIETDMIETYSVVYFRCIKCGKWIKEKEE